MIAVGLSGVQKSQHQPSFGKKRNYPRWLDFILPITLVVPTVTNVGTNLYKSYRQETSARADEAAAESPKYHGRDRDELITEAKTKHLAATKARKEAKSTAEVLFYEGLFWGFFEGDTLYMKCKRIKKKLVQEILNRTTPYNPEAE